MTVDYVNDIINYIDKNKQLSNTFGNCSKVYSMTTENLCGFLSKYNLQDKKVLTVAGSGDQRLNSYLMGASHVTMFDINPLTMYNAELKDTAIKKLNYEKFINFFKVNNRKYNDYYKFLDGRLYEELKYDLSDDTREIYNYFINNNIPYENIYYQIETMFSNMSKNNIYLLPENYEKLKSMLKDRSIDFIYSNVLNLKEKIKDEKYDLILLSNISDYIGVMFNNEELKCYRELIDSLIPNLNDNGVIQVGYIYSSYGRYSSMSDFCINDFRQQYFPYTEFNTVLVTSFDDINSYAYDKVITYTRKRI